jgi:hypothetical protein
MASTYNTVIVGAGPAGLAFANYSLLANPKQKIIIIEKDNVIGGCHKVNRVKYNDENYFCEHGPRIYLNNYVNFIHLLKTMNLNFKNIFTKFNFSLFDISMKIIFSDNIFTINEILYLTRDFLFVLFSNTYGLNVSMKTYLESNNFSKKSIDYIDGLCRSLDGADNSRLSLNQFFNMTIQGLLYSIYQPKIPNDEGLFNYWKKYLELNNVKFLTNKLVVDIVDIDDSNKIEKIILDDKTEIKGDNFILAIPPTNLIKILENNKNEKIKNSFGNINELKEFTEKTKYNEYISIALHWDYELNLDKNIYGLGIKTEWGLIAINLSEYMKFKESKSKTVISCAIILPDIKSSYSNKTANECKTKEELFEDVYQQLRTVYKNISKPSLYFLNNYYDKNENKWKSGESSYVKVPNTNYLNFKNNKYANLYNLGTHNGNNKNSFTSLESAVSNSIKLSNYIYKKNIKIKRCFDIRDLTVVILAIIILLLLIRYNGNI